MGKKLVNYPVLIVENEEVHVWDIGTSDGELKGLITQALSESGVDISDEEVELLMEEGTITTESGDMVRFTRSSN